MVSTVSSAVLGLTVGCTRCHDHKTDPIPQRDYYRLLAVFAGTERKAESIPTADEKVAAEAAVNSRKDEIEKLRAQLAELEEEKPDRRDEDEMPAEDFVGPPTMSRWWRHRIREADKVRAQIQSMEGVQSRLATAVVAGEMSEPPKSFLLLRGDPKAPADEVAPGAPIVLTKNQWDEQEPRRAALAKWVTSPDNPLTAQRDRQSRLALPLWPGTRRHTIQLRHLRRDAKPSRIARLAGRRVRAHPAGV